MSHTRILKFITLSLFFSNYLTFGDMILGRESSFLHIAIRAVSLALLCYGTYHLFEPAINGLRRELREKGLRKTISSVFSGDDDTDETDEDE